MDTRHVRYDRYTEEMLRELLLLLNECHTKHRTNAALYCVTHWAHWYFIILDETEDRHNLPHSILLVQKNTTSSIALSVEVVIMDTCFDKTHTVLNIGRFAHNSMLSILREEIRW